MAAMCPRCPTQGRSPELIGKFTDLRNTMAEVLDVPLKVDPLNPGSIAQVRYRNDGTVWSEDSGINRDLDKLLNLNSGAFSLKENRRRAFVSLQKKIEGHCRAHGPQSKRNWCAKMYGRISNATTKSEYVALRGLVWVDASANRVAAAYTSAPLRNRRLT